MPAASCCLLSATEYFVLQQAPRRRVSNRQRTSHFMGVGSSNRKNQWQARILVAGKVCLTPLIPAMQPAEHASMLK